jgi:RNA polymerase primary sigma factor
VWVLFETGEYRGEHRWTSVVLSVSRRMVSTLETYLSDVARYPLLSADEEVALATQYQLGQAAEGRLSEANELGLRERRELEASVTCAERARERMIRSNLRLVISQARRYAGRGLSFDDLVQEGNIGLIEAVERYDPHRGVRFSTYAVPWIQQKMRRAIENQVRMVRLPVHVTEDLYRLHKATNTLSSNLERRPTPEELAVQMDMSLRKVRRLLRWERRVLSLNSPIGDEQDSELVDLIADQDAPSMEETFAHRQMRERVQDMMTERLRPRECEVLRMRFGLDGKQGQTLKQIADALGVTRERVRQIEARALRRLRHASVRDRELRERWA